MGLASPVAPGIHKLEVPLGATNRNPHKLEQDWIHLNLRSHPTLWLPDLWNSTRKGREKTDPLGCTVLVRTHPAAHAALEKPAFKPGAFSSWLSTSSLEKVFGGKLMNIIPPESSRYPC